MTHRAAGHPGRVLDGAAVLLSRISRGGLGWAALAVALQRRRAVRTMAAAWTADGLALVLSKAIGRERPCPPALLPCPDSPSFPSNHSATAAAAASMLADDAPRLVPLLALGAAAVAAARVRAGVHHTSDVVGGLALGLAVAAAVRRLGPDPA